jgi:hypothetical protein
MKKLVRQPLGTNTEVNKGAHEFVLVNRVHPTISIVNTVNITLAVDVLQFRKRERVEFSIH